MYISGLDIKFYIRFIISDGWCLGKSIDRNKISLSIQLDHQYQDQKLMQNMIGTILEYALVY